MRSVLAACAAANGFNATPCVGSSGVAGALAGALAGDPGVGATGTTGTSGIPGAAGAPGAPGTTGATGVAGAAGCAGGLAAAGMDAVDTGFTAVISKPPRMTGKVAGGHPHGR